MTPRRSPALLALLAIFAAMSVRAGLDALRLAGELGRFRDGEELLSPSAGLFLWHTGWWSHTLDLQYKAFCGGCTVHTLTAAVLLGLGGDSVWVWKAVPLAWSLAQVPLAALALRALFPDRSGTLAAAVALLLFALPPLGATDAGLMGWGNHAESGAFVLGALALVPRPGGSWLWPGLVAGLGVWFCRTTTYVLPVLFLLAGRGFPRLLLGMVVGAAPMLLPAARGEVGAYDVGVGGRSGAAVFLRLCTLWQPTGLGSRLWPGLRDVAPLTWAWLAAAGAAVVAGGRRSWPLLLLAATFVVGFAMADVDIPLRGQRVMNLRYHAPWFLVVPMLVAGAVGASAGWRRYVATASLLVMVGANAVGRWRGFVAPVPVVSAPTGGFTDFLPVAFRFTPEELAAVHADTPEIEAVARRMEGYALAASVLRGERTRDAALATALATPGPTPAQTDVLAGFGAVLSAADARAFSAWVATLPAPTREALTSMRSTAPLRLPPDLLRLRGP